MVFYRSIQVTTDWRMETMLISSSGWQAIGKLAFISFACAIAPPFITISSKKPYFFDDFHYVFTKTSFFIFTSFSSSNPRFRSLIDRKKKISVCIEIETTILLYFSLPELKQQFFSLFLFSVWFESEHYFHITNHFEKTKTKLLLIVISWIKPNKENFSTLISTEPIREK